MTQQDTIGALVKILDELIDGAGPDAAWVLNPDDQGLLNSLARLTSAQASASPEDGSSVAAHVDHLRYGLELLNRWSRGEEPFAGANYSASWQRSTVSETEWTSLREALRQEAEEWREAIQSQRRWGPTALTGAITSVVHLAYHFGAIRQINRAARGPAARD